MRVFLAGASGVIGRALVPLLVDAGHTVGGLTRSESKVERLREASVTPILCDVYDRDGLVEAVADFGPELVIHQLTDLPDNASQLPEKRSDNARIRIEGTRNLVEAFRRAGARKLLAQSVAWQPPPGEGAEAVTELERMVLQADGVVLRYGQFYGPGTFYPADPMPEHPRVGVETAARATMDALDAPSGVLTIVDPEG